MIDKQTRFYGLILGGLFLSRHLVNTFDHTFDSLDSGCESSVFHNTKTYQSPISSSPISSSPKKKKNLVKFVLPPLQRQAAQVILQLLLRSEPTPQCHYYTPISSNGFSEKLSGLLSSLSL